MVMFISIFGGLLLMMGHHARSEALFYYFRLEDQIPENHLLRLIDKHISFEFVRQRLKSELSRWRWALLIHHGFRATNQPVDRTARAAHFTEWGLQELRKFMCDWSYGCVVSNWLSAR